MQASEALAARPPAEIRSQDDSERLPTPEDYARLPLALQRELRSDHAGETGAVWIYRGILAVNRDPQVVAFAREHLETEERHLAFFESSMPRELRTRAPRACAAAGWLTGALPALFGARAVFATIAAVETFVDDHYQAQVDALEPLDQPRLRAVLQSFQADEVDHRDDAAARFEGRQPWLLRAWCGLVGVGSAAGVVVARRL